MKKSIFTSVVAILLSLTTIISAQSSSAIAGKVFPNSEAEKLFGPVHASVKVPVGEIQKQLKKVSDYIMFKVKNNDLVITDSKRNFLNAEKGIKLSADEVMHRYSKSVVKELLDKGKSDYIVFEVRDNDVLTVTNGAFTMEFAILCPPICE